MKYTVKPCWSTIINGVWVLESEDEFGYFKSDSDSDSDSDRRTSSCTWVKKEGRES